MNSFYLESERLVLSSDCLSYIQDYQREYTDEIAKYQFPEPSQKIIDIEKLVSFFYEKMMLGEMYEFVILTKEKEFIGMLQVHGLKEKRPEIGIWIKSSAQKKGYAYEVLYTIISYLNTLGKYQCFIYEVDKRNQASIQLMKKFRYLKIEENEYFTRLHRRLYLVKYWINI